MSTFTTRREHLRPTRKHDSAPRRNHRRGLFLERLEDRSLLALISYWSGDNTPLDSVGTNHGTLVGGATYGAGQVGQAFSLDGVDDRVQVADSPSLALTNSMTIEAWVRANSLPSQQGEIFFRGDDRGGLDPYSLSLQSNGMLRWEVVSGPDAMNVWANMPLGQFVHIAATLDDATGFAGLYLNGVLVSQITTTVRPFGSLDPASNPGIGIGNHGGYPSTPHNFPFDGLIDELKVYDHALTAQDVLDAFNATKGSLQPSVSVSDAEVVEGDQSVKYLGNFISPGVGGLDDPHEIIYGPDGHLYVATRTNNSVLRYDAVTGEPLPAPNKTGAEFVSPGAGGLSVVRGIAFGPDGNLYAAGSTSDSIHRFDRITGESLGTFIAPGVGGLDHPRGLLFHSDGYVYVTSVGGEVAAPGKDAILRFDATTGEPAGVSGDEYDATFVASGSGGLDNPMYLVVHQDDFFVTSSATPSSSVLRYASDGTFLEAFVQSGSGGLSTPVDLAFQGGYLYVTAANGQVLRYDGATGDFVDVVASGGGLARATGLLFEAGGTFLVASGDSDEIRRYGESNALLFTVSLGAPFPTAVSVDYATADGSALDGSDYVAATGSIIFAPGQTSRTILVQTLDDTAYEGNETFTVNLSNPVGGLIVDGEGVGTIVENDPQPTKFYVVDDATANQTFEYAADGTAIENYTVSSGNAAPRGAASTAAGDRVWVVDANRNVYIYDAGGTLLGSWNVTGFNTSAQFVGIATNGTDVWIADAKSDKVYRYAGAASRLYDSQGAASSFALNSGNKDATDLVTDGISIWVLNNASTDKVFKYSLNGGLLGSWTVSTSGATSPTGITLDPANPSHLWIVDNGTDRVYQYDNAVGRTSQSQSASTSFSLTAGNTNPQGIADPPVAGEGSSTAPAAEAAPPRWDGRLLGVDSWQPRGTISAVDQLLTKGSDLDWLDQRLARAAAGPPSVEAAANDSQSAFAETIAKQDQSAASDAALLDMLEDGDLFGGARKERR